MACWCLFAPKRWNWIFPQYYFSTFMVQTYCKLPLFNHQSSLYFIYFINWAWPWTWPCRFNSINFNLTITITVCWVSDSFYHFNFKICPILHFWRTMYIFQEEITASTLRRSASIRWNFLVPRTTIFCEIQT